MCSHSWNICCCWGGGRYYIFATGSVLKLIAFPEQEPEPNCTQCTVDEDFHKMVTRLILHKWCINCEREIPTSRKESKMSNYSDLRRKIFFRKMHWNTCRPQSVLRYCKLILWAIRKSIKGNNFEKGGAPIAVNKMIKTQFSF